MLYFGAKKDKTRSAKIAEIRDYIVKNINGGVFVTREQGCIAMIAAVDGTETNETQLYAWIMLKYGPGRNISLMPQNRGIGKIAEIIYESGWEFTDVTLTLGSP